MVEAVKPELFRVPLNEGVMVKAEPEFVMELPNVRPLNDWVVVPTVIVPV